MNRYGLPACGTDPFCRFNVQSPTPLSHPSHSLPSLPATVPLAPTRANFCCQEQAIAIRIGEWPHSHETSQLPNSVPNNPFHYPSGSCPTTWPTARPLAPTPANLNCSSADHTIQKNRWKTHRPAELTHSIDSFPKTHSTAASMQPHHKTCLLLCPGL